MRIECNESGLHPENIIPELHLELKRVVYNKYGTTNGIFNKIVIKGMEYVVGLHKGDYEKVELVDHRASLSLTHTENTHKTLVFRKNQRIDLTRISIHKIPKKLYDTIINFAEEKYGTKYGVISYIVNQAIELMTKVERNFVELVETTNKPNNSFIGDEEGRVALLDSNSLLKAVEYLTSTVYELKNDIKKSKKSTIQSTLNIIPRAVGKVKSVVSGTVKSARRDDKYKKAERILENVMKWNEHGFTIKEYHKSLGKLEKQGDPRTARSDLDMLKADNRINKIRNSAHGTETYEFIENNQYYKYNTDFAKTKFFEAVKTHFHDVDEFRLDELNELIFSKYGLFDAKSQNRYLKWLIVDGYVKRHPVNPRLLLRE